MSWARYDDELSLNCKVGRLRALGVNGIAALGLHLLANTYCRHNGTGGHVDNHVPELLVGKSGCKLAAILEQVGMFDVSTDGGWMIHNYDEYHDPNDPDPDRSAAARRRELREKRVEAGRLGGLAKASNAASKPLAVLQQTSSPVPVPIPLPTSERYLHRSHGDMPESASATLTREERLAVLANNGAPARFIRQDHPL
jgi:hypothetical protein